MSTDKIHCSEEERYHKQDKMLPGSLAVGAKEKDIDNLIGGSGDRCRSSDEALKHLKDLIRKAEVLLKEGKVRQAEKCFSEGIAVPNLLPVNLGEAYEKRAEFFLGQIKDIVIDANKCSNALLDASKALELNSSSWVAHYLLAQCYRHQNELSQAVDHYEQALAMSPNQKQVKKDLEGCKALEERQKWLEQRNPYPIPVTLSDRIAQLETETGIKMTKKEFLDFKVNVEGKVFPGQDHVFRGHQYMMGWGVSINYEEAVSHYQKAAMMKNAEGMYNLGLCCQYGRGGKRNVAEALRLYREVAEMNPKPLGKGIPQCDVSVAAAQHSIALMYDNGVGVEQDFPEAAGWYKRAMDNGVGNSANNLGILYSQGRGLPQDKKMAEMCWKQGVALKDTNAAASLTEYYMAEMEPDKAKAMYGIGKEMGNLGLINLPESVFNKMLADVTKSRSALEPEVLEFERTHRLSKKGFTFRERLNRQGYMSRTLKLQQLFENRNPADFSKKNFGGNTPLEQPAAGSGSPFIPTPIANPKVGSSTSSSNVLERKTHLKNPTRKNVVTAHREMLKDCEEEEERLRGRKPNVLLATQPPKLKQTRVKQVASLQPITLSEMNPTQDFIFENRRLEVTIMDEPNPHFASIHLLAEDENGDLIRVYIYNVEKTEKSLQNFQPGCRLAIMNPYMRIGGMSTTPGIRNDEPRNLVYLPKVENMCRFCGEGNAPQKCAKCKRPYCSRECQKLDWKMMDHKLLCGLKF